MSSVTIPYRYKTRGGTAANLATVNEVPLARELVIETDTGFFKIGNGTTAYNDLPYAGVYPASSLPYDNATSGLSAATVQAAIDEVAASGGGGSGGGGGEPIPLSIYRKIVSWWEMDETTGTAMVDAHSNALNGTYSGATLNQTGLAANLGASITFAANTGYAEVADTAQLRPMFNLACMVWVKPSGTQPNFAKILWKPAATQANGNATYLLQQDNFSNGGKAVFRVTNRSTGANTDAATSTALSSGTVYHLIGNRCNDQLQMWRNGVMESTTQFDTPTPTTTGGYPLRLGSSGSNDGLVGSYGQAAVFRDYLTPAEIAYLYNGGLGVSYAVLKAAAGF